MSHRHCDVEHSEFQITIIGRCLVSSIGKLCKHFGPSPDSNHCILIVFTKDFLIKEPRYETSINVVGVTSKGSDQPAHTRSLIRAFACRLKIP